jgi:hypothetical protein
MQALNNFISPIIGIDGDIPMIAVPVSAQSPSDEPTSDPSTRASASGSTTQVGNWKAATNLTPQKKARKTTGRSAGGIKINESTPKAHVLAPPSGPQQKIPIQHSKRYAHHAYVSSLTIL